MSEGTRKMHWYAAYTKINQELTIKKRLDHLAIENYLAIRDEVRETSFGKKNVRVILIPHLIFIRTDQTTAFSLLNEHGLNVVYLKDLETRHLLIVPDKQMRDFMFVMDLSPESVILNDESFAVGVKVQVVKGDLCGVEGELVSIANRTHVMIRINGILTASIKVPKSYLHILS